MEELEVTHLRCVKIVHPLSEVRLYRMLSAFFRLVGVFACENIEGHEYGDATDWECKVESGQEASENALFLGFDKALEKVIEKFGEKEVGTLREISKIYKKYDLMRASYAQDYFGDSEIEFDEIYKQMENARERFLSALEDLNALEAAQGQDAYSMIYLWAAKSSCRRRSNELYTILWNAIQSKKYGKDEAKRDELKKMLWNGDYYDLDDINPDIEKILKRDPEFYGAYAIRGFVMEMDEDYSIDSVKDIKSAISIIGEKSYTSYLYYRIGRYCERVRSNLDVKIDYYKKAVEMDSNNYRAICKLAEYAKKEQRYEDAAELWEKVLRILEERKALPSLQPIECAYLYRAYHELGKLYTKQGKYDEAIASLKSAEAMYLNKCNEEGEKAFYPWMFSRKETAWKGELVEGWKIYKKAAKDKLQIINVYVDFLDIAARINDKEMFETYRSKKDEAA